MADVRVSQEDRDNSPDNESLMGTIQLCREAVFDGEPDGSGDYGTVCSNRKVIELCKSVIALRGKLATVRAEEREACAKAGSDAVLGIVAGAKSWLEWQRTLNREPGAAPKTTRDEVANAVAVAIRGREGK